MSIIKNIFKNFNLNWLLALIVISVTWVNLNHERWLHKNVIEQDVANYYAYLPASIIEHDLTLSFLNHPNHQHKDEKYWPNKAPNGNYVIKMSMGMALSYLPFFLLAHGFAHVFNYSTNGFSEPYQFAILFSSLFYFILSVFFLVKILRLYFNEKIVLLTIFCLSFATNIFYYLTLGAGLSHIFSFALMSVFIFYSLHWQQHQSFKTAIIIGCLIGLLTLVRPINALAFLFFFLFNFQSIISGKKIVLPIVLQFFVMALMALILFSPQLFYWKWLTGDYLFNSYVGEHFYFNNPHFIAGLFSFRKGWLIYTPIMSFSMLGFLFLKNKLKHILIPLIIFTGIYLYVCFSWWCWWYGGSCGQRALIDIYPFLALPFAAFIERFSKSPAFLKRTLYVLISCFTFLNLFQTAQAKYNILHYDSMTRANYLQIFFTMTTKPDREHYLLHPNYEKAKRGEEEY